MGIIHNIPQYVTNVRTQVNVRVVGVNGARLAIGVMSDGFLVDLTSPIMTAMADTLDGGRFQSDNSVMQISWNFEDWESGIEMYKFQIQESYHGVKQAFWPSDNSFKETRPVNPSAGQIQMSVSDLSLKDGATYSLHVTALNRARLSTAHETTGVTVDTSPPSQPKVRIRNMICIHVH